MSDIISINNDHRGRARVRPSSPYPRMVPRVITRRNNFDYYMRVFRASTPRHIQVLPTGSPVRSGSRTTRGRYYSPRRRRSESTWTGTSQRFTTIQWAQNLPLPDRELLSPDTDGPVLIHYPPPQTDAPAVAESPKPAGKSASVTPSLDTIAPSQHQASESHPTSKCGLDVLPSSANKDNSATSTSQITHPNWDVSEIPPITEDRHRDPNIAYLPSISEYETWVEQERQYEAAKQARQQQQQQQQQQPRSFPPSQLHRSEAENTMVHPEASSPHAKPSANMEKQSGAGEHPARHASAYQRQVDGLCAPVPNSPLEDWLKTIPTDMLASFQNTDSDDHARLGIDPTTGKLMEYVEQPRTVVDNAEHARLGSRQAERRDAWSSSFLIQQELLRRKKNEAKSEARQRSIADPVSVALVKPQVVNGKTAKHPSKTKALTIADCFLRPGKLRDAKACADIYNTAVTAKLALPDTEEVPVRRFEWIINECGREKLPFIVATVEEADLTNPGVWPSKEAYRKYMKWYESQPAKDRVADAKIYGFAFLAPLDRGLMNGNEASKETARATVFVHSKYRGSGVGSALLHRLLVQTSLLYHGDVQYEWKDPASMKDGFYRPDFRPISRIVMRSIVNTECSECDRQSKFMKTFQFDKVGHLNQVYQIEKPNGVELYDQVIWMHWANSISKSRKYDDGDESECSYDYPGKSSSPEIRRAVSCHDEIDYSLEEAEIIGDNEGDMGQ
ncbi:hypothetical protein Cob_v003232 [Colletotrichum orbiculare MAFF 240422]|uniref:Uncharacterized protein n=1 Tax=Colletotrichum orbiculare (strain 104-T / ATCC 96160 / CBS 514.97 / LARS 414 / MAFF 240422) TaxID=1213857 RepID=N4UQ21_COLOR|nr:hypothetical protein Cob_v003232 [Colletotrichum orbiculare MAFF 240422]